MIKIENSSQKRIAIVCTINLVKIDHGTGWRIRRKNTTSIISDWHLGSAITKKNNRKFQAEVASEQKVALGRTKNVNTTTLRI